MDILDYLRDKKNIVLSAEQRAAVLQDGGVLLLAVPGAGKTTVVATRIAHLIRDRGVPARQIRTLTFSREGARDMAARFSTLFGRVIPETPAFSTIHAFCYRLMRHRAGPAGLPELLSDGRQAEIFRGLYREMSGRFGDDDLIDNIGRCYGLVRNRMEALSPRHGSEFGIPGFCDLCRAYADYKGREGLMDFDDILENTLELLKGNAALVGSLRRNAPYLLLDEAQDTTALQHAIVECIATPAGLFMVGDEDQSIFGFRGTSAKLMLDLPTRYPGITVLKTQETFRLTPEVCGAAGRLIALNRGRYDKTMVTAHTPGLPPVFQPIPADRDQGEAVVSLLSALPPDETAALLYRNNPSAFGAADALDRAGIDFYIREQKIRFKHLGIVADLLAFFDLAADGSNLAAFSRIYYKMGAYISRQMLDWTLKNASADGNVFDVLCEAPVEGLSTARILYAKRQVGGLIGLTAPRALDRIFDDLGYVDFLTGRAGGGVRLEQDAQMLDALRSLAVRYPKVPDFLMRIDRLDDLLADHADGEKRATVTLSTIHSAKGQEYDHVFILDLLDGVLPSAAALDAARTGDSAPLEEEVRLCYVAATRTRRALTLLCPTAVGDRDLSPSRFIPVLMGEADRATAPGHVLAGQSIRHRFFGSGKIVSVSEPDLSFTVDFGKIGKKVLHLSILENDRVVTLINESEPSQ